MDSTRRSCPLVAVVLGLAVLALPTRCTAQTTIAVVNDKAKFDLRAAGHAVFVRVSGPGVTRVEARVADVAAGLVPASAITFDAVAPDKEFAPGAWVTLPLHIDTALIRALAPGSHDLTVHVDARDGTGKLVATAAATLTLVIAERQVAPQASPVALAVRRALPFTSVSSTHCVQLHATPAGPIDTPAVEPGELYAGSGATKMVVPGVIVNGRFGGCPSSGAASGNASSGAAQALPPLVVTSTLPAWVSTGTATLRLRGPDLRPDTQIAVQLYSKDWLIWPLLVVVAATLLSKMIHTWLESGRSSAINVADLNQMADELHNLRTMRPGLETDAGFAEVKRLLASATRQQERGDAQGAATTIASAREKLDALITSVTTAPTVTARGLEAVRAVPPVITVETPVDERTTARVLSFSVTNLPQPPAVATWQIGLANEWRTLDVVPEAGATPAGSRVSTRAPIREPGVYAVRLDVDGQPSQATTFRIQPSATERTLATVRKTDSSIDLVAVVLTALVTTVAIWELDSFGTFRDYALQFTGAFGITESVKGFAQVLGAVRKA